MPKRKFSVKIEERREKIIVVEATTKVEALSLAKEQYASKEFSFTDEDYFESSIALTK